MGRTFARMGRARTKSSVTQRSDEKRPKALAISERIGVERNTIYNKIKLCCPKAEN